MYQVASFALCPAHGLEFAGFVVARVSKDMIDTSMTTDELNRHGIFELEGDAYGVNSFAGAEMPGVRQLLTQSKVELISITLSLN